MAGIGNGRAQTIFEGRSNLSRPLTLLDSLEMDADLEIKAIPRHEEQDAGIEVQHMVVAALALLQRIARDVNGLSVAIGNVNMRQSHFESVLRAGGRIAGPKVECGESNTKLMAMAINKMADAGTQTDILVDSEGCLSGNKQEHSELAVSDLFNSPVLQNGGGIDLVETLRMLEEPSQLEANTVVCCSCSNSVRTRCPPAHGAVSASRDVVGNVRRHEGSTSSKLGYMWVKIRVPEFRGGDK